MHTCHRVYTQALLFALSNRRLHIKISCTIKTENSNQANIILPRVHLILSDNSIYFVLSPSSSTKKRDLIRKSSVFRFTPCGAFN